MLRAISNNVRALQARFQLPGDRAPQLLDALYRRSPLLPWAVLATFIFGVVALTIAARVTFALLPVEIPERSTIGPALGITLWVCIFVTAATASVAVERLILFTACKRHLSASACFHCGHDLRGLPTTSHMATCPECGNASPIARQQPAP